MVSQDMANLYIIKDTVNDKDSRRSMFMKWKKFEKSPKKNVKEFLTLWECSEIVINLLLKKK